MQMLFMGVVHGGGVVQRWSGLRERERERERESRRYNLIFFVQFFETISSLFTLVDLKMIHTVKFDKFDKTDSHTIFFF